MQNNNIITEDEIKQINENYDNSITTTATSDYELRESCSEKYNYLENDIDALKKRIKHSKNPMEKKSYERQLNLAYKKRKQKENRKEKPFSSHD